MAPLAKKTIGGSKNPVGGKWTPCGRQMLAFACASLLFLAPTLPLLAQSAALPEEVTPTKTDPDVLEEAKEASERERRTTALLLSEFSPLRGGPSQSLSQLLEFAKLHAPNAQVAKQRLGLAGASLAGAKRLQPSNPQLQGEFGTGLPEGGLPRLRVTLTQQLEVAGERGLRIKAAQAQHGVLQAEQAQVHWDLHQSVHRLYRLGSIHRRRVQVEEDILAFTQRLFEVALLRFRAGEEPRISLVVAGAEMAKARRQVVRAWGEYARTRRDLAATIGWRQDTPPKPTDEPGGIKPLPAQDTLLQKALHQDPELAMLLAKVAQARAQLALQKRERWPEPILGLGFEREEFGPNEVENILVFVLGLRLPLWDLNQQEIATAQTQSAILDQSIASRRTVIKNHVLKHIGLVQTASKEARIYETDVLPAFESQLELLQQGFRLGELSLLDVMNARDRLLEVQRQYLEAVQTYHVALSDLEGILGTPVWNEEKD